MRVRTAKFEDYGISRARAAELREMARRDDMQQLLEEAAEQSNPDLASLIVTSLYYKMSYDELRLNEYIPIKRDDFYGYQRRALAYFGALIDSEDK